MTSSDAASAIKPALLLALTFAIVLLSWEGCRALTAIRNLADDCADTARTLGTQAANLSQAADTMAAKTGELLKQAKLAVMSWRGVSFDLRKNYTADAELRQRFLASIDRLDQAMIDALAQAGSTAPAIRATLRSVEEAVRDLAGKSGGVLDSLRSELLAAGAETREAIAGVRPLLDSSTALIAATGRGAASVANMAEYVEKKLTAPKTRWEKVKMVLGLVAWGASVTMPFWWRPSIKAY